MTDTKVRPPWRRWKWIAAVVLGLGLLLGAWIADYVIAVWPYYVHNVRTTSTKPVEVIAEGHRFMVPQSHFRLPGQRWGGDLTESRIVPFKGALPDLAPFSEATRATFDSPNDGIGDVVVFGLRLWRFGVVIPQLRQYYLDPARLAECGDGPAGYRFCRTRDYNPKYPNSILNKHDILVKQNGDRIYIFDCGWLNSVGFASCKGYFPLFDNIDLRITFDRTKIFEAEEIVAKTFSKVCGFYRGRGTRQTKINLCERKLYHGTR